MDENGGDGKANPTSCKPDEVVSAFQSRPTANIRTPEFGSYLAGLARKLRNKTVVCPREVLVEFESIIRSIEALARDLRSGSP
jgi:hypothetical protein